MKHYICKGGCKGVSEKPVTCGAKDCPKHGVPLELCNCKDGKHDGAFDARFGEKKKLISDF